MFNPLDSNFLLDRDNYLCHYVTFITFSNAAASIVAVTLVGSFSLLFTMIACIAFIVEVILSYVVVSAVAPVTPFKPVSAAGPTRVRKNTTGAHLLLLVVHDPMGGVGEGVIVPYIGCTTVLP